MNILTFSRDVILTLLRDIEKEKGKHQTQQAAQTGKFLDAASRTHLRPGKWWGCTLKDVGALGAWKGQQANNQITTLPPLLLSGNSCPLISVLILYLFLKVCNSTTLNQNAVKKDSNTQWKSLGTLDIKNVTQRKKYIHEMSLNTTPLPAPPKKTERERNMEILEVNLFIQLLAWSSNPHHY